MGTMAFDMFKQFYGRCTTVSLKSTENVSNKGTLDFRIIVNASILFFISVNIPLSIF